MLQLPDIPSLQAWISAERKAARRLGFVPTMGALHEGHLSLVDEARRRADTVLLSIFVNPLQFGPSEDFARYPRDLERDRRLAGERGVAALFVPPMEVMYPPGSEVRVVPGDTASRWEGEMRPGHFTGVLTVVAKLLNLVRPDVAVFGQKDIQQATLIRRMVRDLDFPVEIALGRTVREPDGLALSSRNAYLAPADRQAARALSLGLRAAQFAWDGGESDAAALARRIRREMEVFPAVAPEYIAVVDPVALAPVTTAIAGTILAVAARIGATRLIDNVILGDPPI